MSKPWTQRIGMLIACGSLLSVLASQIVLPQNTAGRLAMQDSSNTFTAVQYFNAGITVQAGGITGGPTLTKCVNIDPTNSLTDWIFYKFKAAVTITAIDCIVDAATSVVLTLRECDANGANCGNTEAAITCATTNTTQSGGIDDAAVAAGSLMRITRGTVTGSPTQAHLCVTYTEP